MLIVRASWRNSNHDTCRTAFGRSNIRDMRPKPYLPTTGWLEDFPQRHGLDGALLLAIRAHVEAKLPQIRSVLVARHGYIVFEMYRQGFGRSTRSHLASITKSVTSMLFGMALDRGWLSLDQRLAEAYPGLIAASGPGAGDITVEHLLAMNSGLRWQEAEVGGWRAASHTPRFPLIREMASAPGTTYVYDTPASHVLSAVFQRAAGVSLADFARDALFAPLGITAFEWEADAQGYPYGGHGLHLTSRDALKLGLLMLRRGLWDGAQILTPDWVDTSTDVHATGYPEIYGAYGYLWWITELRGHKTFFAAGAGGQYLFVFPDSELLVLITSNQDRLYAQNKQIARDFVLPALRPA
jgi:CubicO group peptidase (beta-lactamase class C family)